MNGRYDIWRTAAPDDDPDDDQVEDCGGNDYDPVDSSGPDNSRNYEDTITEEERVHESCRVALMKANKEAFEQKLRAEAYAALLQEIADWCVQRQKHFPSNIASERRELETLRAKIKATLAEEVTVESIIIKAIDKPE